MKAWLRLHARQFVTRTGEDGVELSLFEPLVERAPLSSPSVPPPDSPEAASQHIFQTATGYIASTALYVATRLRIADELADGPVAVSALAADAGVNEDALYRMLRLLASLGIFAEVSPRTFANTPPSQTLLAGAPGSTYDMALWMADPFHFRVYAEAMHSVTTGQPAVEKATGVPVFEYFPQHPELSEVFNSAMTAFSAMIVPAAIAAYDFSGIGTLVDVAGGHGQLLISVLQAHPAMQGILMDLPHVIAGAVPRIRAAGLEGRLTAEAGDFFTAVPACGDAYVMKHIIHDWDDERAALILRNIRKAMNPGGRVILLESVLSPGSDPDFGKVIDIEMLLMPGGRERTEEEFRALFAAAGLTLTRVVPTQSPLSVIEAR